MKIPHRLRVVLGLIFICFVWGSTWLSIKEILDTVPPFLAAGSRFVIAIIILRMMMSAQGISLPSDKEFWLLNAQLALVTYTIPFALIYSGQRQIPSGLSAILFATLPFWVAVFTRFRLKSAKLPFLQVVGIVLAFIGVCAILERELVNTDRAPMFGMLAVIASAGLQAYGLVSLIKSGKGYSPITVNFAGMLMAGIILLSASPFIDDYSKLHVGRLSIIWLLYQAVFGTVLTYVIYFWLAKHLSPVILSMTSFVTPIVAVALGTLVRGEEFHKNIILGAVLVLLGILSANIKGIVDRLISRFSPPDPVAAPVDVQPEGQAPEKKE